MEFIEEKKINYKLIYKGMKLIEKIEKMYSVKTPKQMQDDYFKMSSVERAILEIPNLYRKAKTFKKGRTSYGYKHDLESYRKGMRLYNFPEAGMDHYISNTDMKIAFLQLGFEGIDFLPGRYYDSFQDNFVDPVNLTYKLRYTKRYWLWETGKLLNY